MVSRLPFSGRDAKAKRPFGVPFCVRPTHKNVASSARNLVPSRGAAAYRASKRPTLADV